MMPDRMRDRRYCQKRCQIKCQEECVRIVCQGADHSKKVIVIGDRALPVGVALQTGSLKDNIHE